MTTLNEDCSAELLTHASPEAREDALVAAMHALFAREPSLTAILSIEASTIVSIDQLLVAVLAGAMGDHHVRERVRDAAVEIFRADSVARESALADIANTSRKNFEPGGAIATLLFSRGIHALLGHRVTYSLWSAGRTDLALALKTVFGRSFATDIHPAARFGRGIWLDHGLGFVVGETSIIEDDVSIWHGVTLGSTLKDSGDRRHPQLRRGVTIGAGAILLGGVEIGEGSVVAAGSVVLNNVPPATTVAGIPAKPKPRGTQSFAGL